MKKLLTFMLVIFYSLSATSATVHFHFCQGEAQSFSLDKNNSSHEKCKLCNKKKKSCHQNMPSTKEETGCKNLAFDLKKVDDSHFSSDSSKVFPSISPAIHVLHWIVLQQLDFQNSRENINAFFYEKPHQQTNKPPYLIHCSFRI